jgi:hypothetical protein
VKMTLHTGGAGVIGQQMLVAVSGSATEELATPPYSTNIPYGQITIPGLGKNLGTDGNAYGEANNGASVDVTPTVTGVPMYSFTVGGGAYLLSITANGIDLSTNTPEFCVGQKVTFAGAWDSDPGAASTSYSWALAGTFVNRSTQGNSYSSVNWDIDPDSLNSAEPFAYWITGGNKNAYLHETLHFSNGQSATITASGQFSIYRPSVVMLTNNIYGTPMNIWITPWNLADFGDIALGVESTTNCIGYKVQVISTDFSAGLGGGSGGAKITQLCTIDAEKGAGYGLYNIPVNVTDALDGSDPYGAITAVIKTNNPPSDRNTIELDDAPETGAYDAFHYYGTFTDYIMFSPDGGIYVPLGKITWGTTFQAISPSTTIYNNSVSGPAGPDGSYDFPVWTSTYSP